MIETVPPFNSHLVARQVMSKEVKWLPIRPRVQQIVQLLLDTKHNGFPILNEDLTIRGLISRHTLIVLLGQLNRIPEVQRVSNLSADSDSDTSLTW